MAKAADPTELSEGEGGSSFSDCVVCVTHPRPRLRGQPGCSTQKYTSQLATAELSLSLSLSLSRSHTVIIAISAPPPPLRPESHLLNYSLRWTSFTLLPTAEVVLVDGGGGSTIKVEGATDTSSLGLGLRRLDKGRTDSSEERSGAVAAGYDGGVRSMAGRKEGRKTERGQRRQELAGRLTPTPPFRSRQIRFHFPWAPPSLPSHFQIFKF